MNTLALPAPGASPGDRMGVALLFSLIVHGILILGLGFHFAQPAPAVPTLDVTLVNVANSETPTKADFLAQANNAGGGNSDKARRPGAPFSGPLPVADPGIAPVPVLPAAPAQQVESGAHIITTTATSKHRAAQQRDTRAESAPQQQVSPIPIPRRMEMARLAEEVRADEEAYARRPRRKFVSANTRVVADAAYQVAWVRRVERIGNLNYPDAARRRNLHGDLMLTVAIGADGAVRGVTIVRSSGYPLLDDAAKRIIQLAAPYPPIPRQRDADGHPITELDITRVFEFLPGDRLATKSAQ